MLLHEIRSIVDGGCGSYWIGDSSHKHRFKLSRVDTRTYGVRDSCWGFYYQVYVFECSDFFCPVIWDVGVEDFWDGKTYGRETPD